MTYAMAIRILDKKTCFDEMLKTETTADKLKTRADEALKMAIEALEKQIPKKPSGTLTISGISRYKSGVCKCGTAIAMVYKYCPNCGQAIDWSEGEFDCSQA